MQPHEVLTSAFIPFNVANEYVREFKQVRQPPVSAIIARGLCKCHCNITHIARSANLTQIPTCCVLPQAHRRDDDIAIVNAGMRVRMAQTSQGAGTEAINRLFAGRRRQNQPMLHLPF